MGVATAPAPTSWPGDGDGLGPASASAGVIVHRDFKPQNVLIGADGPRVIDFGIARALDAAATMTNSAIGTPAYMAPEQLPAQEITPAADIFSWASTMVYAATGQSPFGQDTVMAVIHRIINEPPDLGAMEEPLRGIVADCLAKDPGRPPTQALLMRLLGEEGLTPRGAAAPPRRPRSWARARRSRARAAGRTCGGRRGTAGRPARLAEASLGGAAGADAATASARAAAALAGLLVAAGVVAVVVWAASRGGDHPSAARWTRPRPPARRPLLRAGAADRLPTHRQQTYRPAGRATSRSDRPDDDARRQHPPGGTSEPDGGDTTAARRRPDRSPATVAPDPGAGGGEATQPAAEADRWSRA